MMGRLPASGRPRPLSLGAEAVRIFGVAAVNRRDLTLWLTQAYRPASSPDALVPATAVD